MEGLGRLALDRISEAYSRRPLDEGTAPQALQRLIEALVPIVHQFAYLVGEPQLPAEQTPMMAGDRTFARGGRAALAPRAGGGLAPRSISPSSGWRTP